MLIAAVWTASAACALEVFTADVHGEARTARLAVALESEGRAYVSLPSLVQQVGGGMRFQGSAFQVDLGGGSAALATNSTQVTASSDSFSLAHPIISQGNTILIAADDVEAFFSRAFQVKVLRQREAPAAPAPAAEEARLEEPEALLGGDVAAPPPPEKDLLTAIEPEETTPTETQPDPSAASTPAQGQDAAQAATASIQGLSVVVLDPGHGGHDAGVVGAQEVIEKDITLALAREVGRILKEDGGITVFLTRSEDRDLSTTERKHAATEAKAGLLVSLHSGAALAPEARGYAVFHQPGEAKSAAIAESVARALSETVQPEWSYHAPRAVPLRLMAGSPMPSILVEAGFATNPDDARLLLAPDGLARVAQGIARGILAAVKIEKGA